MGSDMVTGSYYAALADKDAKISQTIIDWAYLKSGLDADIINRLGAHWMSVEPVPFKSPPNVELVDLVEKYPRHCKTVLEALVALRKTIHAEVEVLRLMIDAYRDTGNKLFTDLQTCMRHEAPYTQLNNTCLLSDEISRFRESISVIDTEARAAEKFIKVKLEYLEKQWAECVEVAYTIRKQLND